MRSTIDLQLGRREFLAAGGAIAAASLASQPTKAFEDPTRRQGLKVAAVVTEFTYRSHTHVILENFLEPYLFNGRLIEPQCQVVSFYADQRPPNDMAGAVAKQYGITMYEMITDALTLGGDKLPVDAVLSIGEHGSYPVNDKRATHLPTVTSGVAQPCGRWKKIPQAA